MSLVELAQRALTDAVQLDRAQVVALFAAWVRGDLIEVGADSDRRLGRFFAALPRALTDDLSVQRMAHGEADVRRWCWAVGWWLSFDDEDLVLMRDDYVVPLLEEAAAGCTKAGEATDIVAHHCRDSAHALLWKDPAALPAFFTRVGAWLTLARQTRDARVVTYLERLASYAEPRRVSRDEAEQRVRDLRRCRDNPALVPALRLELGRWIAPMKRVISKPFLVSIDEATGAMFGADG